MVAPLPEKRPADQTLYVSLYTAETPSIDSEVSALGYVSQPIYGLTCWVNEDGDVMVANAHVIEYGEAEEEWPEVRSVALTTIDGDIKFAVRLTEGRAPKTEEPVGIHPIGLIFNLTKQTGGRVGEAQHGELAPGYAQEPADGDGSSA